MIRRSNSRRNRSRAYSGGDASRGRSAQGFVSDPVLVSPDAGTEGMRDRSTDGKSTKRNDRSGTDPRPPSLLHWLFCGAALTASLAYFDSVIGADLGILDIVDPVERLFDHPEPPDTTYYLGTKAFRVAYTDAALLATASMPVTQPVTNIAVRPIPILPDGSMELYSEIPMTITAGYTGDALGGDNVTVERDNDSLKVTVHLPEPEILGCCVVVEDIYRRSDENHFPGTANTFVGMLGSADTEAYRNAITQAVAAGILEEAERSATTRITEMMTTLGADEVVVLVGSEG